MNDDIFRFLQPGDIFSGNIIAEVDIADRQCIHPHRRLGNGHEAQLIQISDFLAIEPGGFFRAEGFIGLIFFEDNILVRLVLNEFIGTGSHR